MQIKLKCRHKSKQSNKQNRSKGFNWKILPNIQKMNTWYGTGAARPFLLQSLIQDVLLVLQHPMEVPHLLLVLSCLVSKVLLLFCQTVTNVIQLQCSQLLVPLVEEEGLCEWGEAACRLDNLLGAFPTRFLRPPGTNELHKPWTGLIWSGKSGS